MVIYQTKKKHLLFVNVVVIKIYTSKEWYIDRMWEHYEPISMEPYVCLINRNKTQYEIIKTNINLVGFSLHQVIRKETIQKLIELNFANII